MLPTSPQASRRSERIKQRTEPKIEQHNLPSPPSAATKSIEESGSNTSDDWVASWVQQTLTAGDPGVEQSALTAMAKVRPIRNNDRSLKNPSSATKSNTIRSWGLEREAEMESHGIHMNLEPHESLDHNSQQLCRNLLRTRHSTPAWFYSTDQFRKMLNWIRKRGEASTTQYLTRILVPSPEMLQIEGIWKSAAITETWGALWVTSSTLLPLSPKSDMVLGIPRSAFTAAELAKLRGHNMLLTVDSGQVHYPFLICEAKGQASIIEAERQAMHAASTSINAILRLCRHAKIYDQLNGQILAFSLAHNTSQAQLYGHFARFDHDNITFHRCELYVANLATSTDETWTRPYKIILAIWDHFFPFYLDMIKGAIDTLPDAPITQIARTGDSEDAESFVHESELQLEVAELKGQVEQMAHERAQQDEQIAHERVQKDEQMAQLLAHLMARSQKDEQMAQERAQKDQQITQLMAQIAQMARSKK